MTFPAKTPPRSRNTTSPACRLRFPAGQRPPTPHGAAIPVDVGIAEGHEPKCEIASVEPLRVPADRYDRSGDIAFRQR
jgi:hypothetical protein